MVDPMWWYGRYFQPWHREQLARWNVRVITPPSVEPVSLAEARLQCRIDAYPTSDSPSLDAHPDDSLLTTLISAAREWCEGYTGRALAPQVIEVSHNSFPWPAARWLQTTQLPLGASLAIQLPMAPIRAIQSVIYRGDDGTDVMLDPATDYIVDVYGYVPHVLPAVGASWPIVTYYPNAVRVRYDAGYAVDTESPDVVPMVPASVKAAMQLLVGHLYRHRENTTELRLSEIPLGAEALLRPFRLHLGVA